MPQLYKCGIVSGKHFTTPYNLNRQRWNKYYYNYCSNHDNIYWHSNQDKEPAKSLTVCSDDCEAESKRGELTCKLTTPGLRQRKETVIKGLKSQILTKKEMKYAYSYKFAGKDKMVDELAEFIKAERACCDFFIFNLSIRGDKSEAWLEITGPKGAKDFIKTELGM